MYTHPHISSQIGSERQRDKLARAEQQRLARRLRQLSMASRQSSSPESPLDRALRALARLRLPIPPTARSAARATTHPVPRSEAAPQA